VSTTDRLRDRIAPAAPPGESVPYPPEQKHEAELSAALEAANLPSNFSMRRAADVGYKLALTRPRPQQPADWNVEKLRCPTPTCGALPSIDQDTGLWIDTGTTTWWLRCRTCGTRWLLARQPQADTDPQTLAELRERLQEVTRERDALRAKLAPAPMAAPHRITLAEARESTSRSRSIGIGGEKPKNDATNTPHGYMDSIDYQLKQRRKETT